jgi:hypothetical protein
MHPAATAASRRDAFEEEEEEEVLRRASEGTVVYCYVCFEAVYCLSPLFFEWVTCQI